MLSAEIDLWAELLICEVIVLVPFGLWAKKRLDELVNAV